MTPVDKELSALRGRLHRERTLAARLGQASMVAGIPGIILGAFGLAGGPVTFAYAGLGLILVGIVFAFFTGRRRVRRMAIKRSMRLAMKRARAESPGPGDGAPAFVAFPAHPTDGK